MLYPLLIVEGRNPKPIHPEFGTYEFEMIKQAIFKNSNFHLIAHYFELNTNEKSDAN